MRAHVGDLTPDLLAKINARFAPFVSFAPTLDSFGQGTEKGCILLACVSYVFSGTLARREKAILSQPAIITRISHDTPHSLMYNYGPTQ